MLLELHTYADPAAYAAKVEPFLMEQEALNNLILGLALRLGQDPASFDEPPFLATAETSEGGMQLAALCTPPHALILAGRADLSDDALEMLAEDLRRHAIQLPGVIAEARLAQRFTRVLAEVMPMRYRVGQHQRVYELRQVIPTESVTGSLRVATSADADMLVSWRLAFAAEALGATEDLESARRAVSRMIERQNFFFWQDREQPVAMAACTRPTQHGITINSVYTPPEQRRKGYATALVAALSQRQLDEGRQFCTLFTDLSNPTSNNIYQKIGYQALGDFTHYVYESQG